MIQLCRRQETPHQFKTPRSSKRLREADDPDEPRKRLKADEFVMDNEFADTTSADDTEEFCYPFCKGDMEAPPRKRDYKYPRRDSRNRHVRGQHLTKQAVGEGFDCPYEECTAFLGGDTHFLRHAEGQHGDCY
jgi:hypothetical protein